MSVFLIILASVSGGAAAAGIGTYFYNNYIKPTPYRAPLIDYRGQLSYPPYMNI
jgi:hypothetical protein